MHEISNTPPSKLLQTVALFGFIAVSLAAGGIGAYFTISEIPTWYAGLQKPSWNPPAWIFGPVWNTLYVMMGVAAWLVWRQVGFIGGKIPLSIFGLQLVFNTLWSIIFFAMHRPDGAFVDIVLLWLAIVATMFTFARVSKVAAWLLLPYLLWVTFASALNFQIWRLNI